jgi:anhydro-N-acetylmuramic acid kinase
MTAAGRLYVGAISGTSVDGLDLALIGVSRGGIRFLAGSTVPFPDRLEQALKALARSTTVDLDELGALDRELGDLIGRSILGFIADHGLAPAAITAIGSHGQTIRHHPDGPWPFTTQIGDPNTIAEVTGIDTFADFRRRDIAAGGQGAPLVPPFHAALFGNGRSGRIVLNIGGIANVTCLPGERATRPTGFDTGPGNALLDFWAHERLGYRYDDGGRWAARGAVVEDLLERCLADSYFSRRPPKSTGKELFNGAWLAARLDGLPPIDPTDVQATLVELTARTIVDAARAYAPDFADMVVCGGGRLNRTLMARLAQMLEPLPVTTTDALGYNGDWIEAAAFAWLGHRARIGRAGNAPAVTGAHSERVLGVRYPGRSVR